jgi:hypothetical protein
MSTDHLARAREYIGRGEKFYGKAADEVIAAMKADPLLTFVGCDKRLGRYKGFSSRLVTWRTKGGNTEQPTPWAGEYDRVKVSLTKSSLRDAPPEQLADLLDDPSIRANVARAQAIAGQRVEAQSYQAQREAIGQRESDQLEQHARYQDAEAELFKARRGLIEYLRILNAVGVGDLDDAWRESLLSTLDDLSAKIEMGKALLGGEIDDADLTALLEDRP